MRLFFVIYNHTNEWNNENGHLKWIELSARRLSFWRLDKTLKNEVSPTPAPSSCPTASSRRNASQSTIVHPQRRESNSCQSGTTTYKIFFTLTDTTINICNILWMIWDVSTIGISNNQCQCVWIVQICWWVARASDHTTKSSHDYDGAFSYIKKEFFFTGRSGLTGPSALIRSSAGSLIPCLQSTTRRPLHRHLCRQCDYQA